MEDHVANKNGFTIVELLIVIVVIAILAIASVITYTGIQNRAHIASVNQYLAQSARLFEAYAIDNEDRYPDNQTQADIPNDPNIITQYSTNAERSAYCMSASYGTNDFYVSNTVKTPIQGVCPGDMPGGSAKPAERYTLFGSSPPPGNYVIINDGDGGLLVANRFYTTREEGIKVVGARLWEPGNAPQYYLSQTIEFRAYTKDWAGSTVGWVDQGSVVQSKTYSQERSAGTWTEVIFDTPIQLQGPLDSSVRMADLLTLAVRTQQGLSYVHARDGGPGAQRVESSQQSGVFLAEDANIGRGSYTYARAGYNEAISTYYAIDLIFEDQ